MRIFWGIAKVEGVRIAMIPASSALWLTTIRHTPVTTAKKTTRIAIWLHHGMKTGYAKTANAKDFSAHIPVLMRKTVSLLVTTAKALMSNVLLDLGSRIVLTMYLRRSVIRTMSRNLHQKFNIHSALIAGRTELGHRLNLRAKIGRVGNV